LYDIFITDLLSFKIERGKSKENHFIDGRINGFLYADSHEGTKAPRITKKIMFPGSYSHQVTKAPGNIKKILVQPWCLGALVA
jgi:hypothetical protein